MLLQNKIHKLIVLNNKDKSRLWADLFGLTENTPREKVTYPYHEPCPPQ